MGLSICSLVSCPLTSSYEGVHILKGSPRWESPQRSSPLVSFAVCHAHDYEKATKYLDRQNWPANKD